MSRRKRPPLSNTRKALEAAYKASYEQIPEKVQCAVCGLVSRKEEMERHHPAGRRKTTYCFTVQIHGHCHRRVHNDPAWATSIGLLAAGRNSRTYRYEDAVDLVSRMPFPPTYALEILRTFSQTKE